MESIFFLKMRLNYRKLIKGKIKKTTSYFIFWMKNILVFILLHKKERVAWLLFIGLICSKSMKRNYKRQCDIPIN
jgi:hypothetical protein